MDARRLREVTPGQRGWRFVGRYKGKVLKANVPYLVITAAAVTRHYTESGARKRLAILAAAGVTAAGVMWDDTLGWQTIRPERRRRRKASREL